MGGHGGQGAKAQLAVCTALHAWACQCCASCSSGAVSPKAACDESRACAASLPAHHGFCQVFLLCAPQLIQRLLWLCNVRWCKVRQLPADAENMLQRRIPSMPV